LQNSYAGGYLMFMYVINIRVISSEALFMKNDVKVYGDLNDNIFSSGKLLSTNENKSVKNGTIGTIT